MNLIRVTAGYDLHLDDRVRWEIRPEHFTVYNYLPDILPKIRYDYEQRAKNYIAETQLDLGVWHQLYNVRDVFTGPTRIVFFDPEPTIPLIRYSREEVALSLHRRKAITEEQKYREFWAGSLEVLAMSADGVEVRGRSGTLALLTWFEWGYVTKLP